LHKIEKKVARIEYYVKLLDDYKSDCKKRFLNDPMFEGALLHYLYLVSDGCIVLSQMVLKEKKINYAQSYFEAIDLLGEKEIIPKDFAYEFAKIASFRNFLAHDYEEIDHIVICEQILAKLDDIELFLMYIKKSLDIG
jgi:uncharacterized protein YutE (UPF0331/DUF86 family)